MHTASVHSTPPLLHPPRLSTPPPPPQAPQNQSRKADSPHEAALLNAYLEAVQRKVLHNEAGLIKVPLESTLGQWLGLYRALVTHPVVQSWLREQKIDASALLSIDPFKGTLSAEADGKTKTFYLSDTSGWAQISGALLAAAKVIAPEDKGALRVRFADGLTQVSAQLVANFQGIPLPSSRAQANEQIRHMEQQEGFDPIAADDRVRPASSRSMQALAVHKQNAATFYSSAPQALAYKRLAVDVATHLPDTRAEAKKWAEALIFKLTGKQVDADTLYLNRFDNYNTPLYGSTASGTEHLNDEPKSSLRLPDALLKNFSEHDGVPGELDTHAGLYTVGYGAGATGGYGARNEFPLAPSKLMHESWKTDFQGQMDKKIENFWSTHGENYEAALKGEFTYQARMQLKTAEARPATEQALQSPEHRFTREDYRLVMGAASNLPLDEKAPLSVEQLKAKAPVNEIVKAYALDIHGITSSDIVRFSAHDGRRQVIYMPGAEPAFLRFDSLDTLNAWITDQAKDPKKREALAAHFPLASRQDHAHKPGIGESILEGLVPGLALANSFVKSKGLDTVLSEMASASLEGPAVHANHSKIEGDVFSTLASASKVRMSSDADIVIKSNSEVIRDTWLNDITVAAGLLAKLAPIAAPVAAAAAITGLAEVALGTEKAASGDSEAERKDGASKAFDGVLNTLFSMGAREIPKDPFELPETAPAVPASGERPAIENPTTPSPANRLRPGQAGNITEHALQNGDQLLENVMPNAQGIYQIKDGTIGDDRWLIRYTDNTGASKIYEIRSDFKLSNNHVQIINPTTRKPVLTVQGAGDGQWNAVRAEGGGKWRWQRASSATSDNESTSPSRIAQRFLQADGSKIEGAEKFDDYLSLNDETRYLFSNTLYQDGATLKRKLVMSWQVDDRAFSVTEGERARPTAFSSSDYSSSFAPDLNREDYSVITKQPSGDLRTEIDYDSSSFEDKVTQRIAALEKAIPKPELRARISEIAHQGSSLPALLELGSPPFKEDYGVGAGQKRFVITYDPIGDVHTVKATTSWQLKMITDHGAVNVKDLDISSTRTFTIRESNKLADNGFSIDPSAPTKIEISMPGAV